MAMLAAIYESMIKNYGQPPGFNEMYNVSALRHFKQAMQV